MALCTAILSFVTIWKVNSIRVSWRQRYLFVGVQQETVPDGAEPRGGQHGAPLLGAGRTGAAETWHDAPHQHHRVVQSKEETVGEESRQDLKRYEQILARHSHVVCVRCAFFQAASFEAPAADALTALMMCPLSANCRERYGIFGLCRYWVRLWELGVTPPKMANIVPIIKPYLSWYVVTSNIPSPSFVRVIKAYTRVSRSSNHS